MLHPLNSLSNFDPYLHLINAYNSMIDGGRKCIGSGAPRMK